MGSSGQGHKFQSSTALVYTDLQGCLILTFPSELAKSLMDRVKHETLERCVKKHVIAVIFDLTAVELLDLTEWSWLIQLSQGVRLMGGQPWFVGLRPSLVTTLISLGAEINGVEYALGVEDAILLSSQT